MFQKEVKSKNISHKKVLSHTMLVKKLTGAHEIPTKANNKKFKTQIVLKEKYPLMSKEIRKAKPLKQSYKDVMENNLKSKFDSKSTKLKGIESFPPPMPPKPSTTNIAHKENDASGASEDFEWKMKDQSRTSNKLSTQGSEILFSRFEEKKIARSAMVSQSKKTFKITEVKTESRLSLKRSSPTSLKAVFNASGLSCKLPPVDFQISSSPKQSFVSTAKRSTIRTTSLTGKQMNAPTGSKCIQIQSSKTLSKTSSNASLPSGILELNEKQKPSKSFSRFSIKSSSRKERPAPNPLESTHRKSTSFLPSRKSIQILGKLQSQHRLRVSRPSIFMGLRKSYSKIKRKLKEKEKEFKHLDNIPHSTSVKSSACVTKPKSVADDSDLPEGLRLLKSVQKLKTLLRFLKQLKESQLHRLYAKRSYSISDDRVEIGQSTLEVEPLSQATEGGQYEKRSLKLLSKEDVNSLESCILKRSYPYSEDEDLSPAAKRFKIILNEVSSGSSSECYTSWKSNVWQEYNETQGQAITDHEITSTESSSSLNEILQKVSLLDNATKFETVESESTKLTPQSSSLEEFHFTVGQGISHDWTEEDLNDRGKFVHPITGLVLTTPPSYTSSSSLAYSSTIDETVEEEDGNIFSKKSMESEELDLHDSLFQAWDERYDKLKNETVRPTLLSEERDALTQFLKQSECLQLPKPDKNDLSLNDPKKYPTMKEMLPHIIQEFLDNLIVKCVRKVEQLRAPNLLCNNLCKRKLLTELESLLREREPERDFTRRLNVRVVDFLRRRQKFALLTNEKNLRYEKLNRERYHISANGLDRLLMRMEEAREYCRQKLVEETELCAKWKEQNAIAVGNLESLIRTSIIRDQEQEKLTQFIDSQLRKMTKVRQEISDLRYKLINMQHQHCYLSQHSSKMQTLENGLSIRQFEILFSEIQSLTKRNQEQDDRNARVRKRCSNFIEQVSHLREQNSMNRLTNEKLRGDIDDLYATVRLQRQLICDMKVEQTNIRQAINDLKRSGGIMDKPLLTWDYDETVKHICELQRNIAAWKHTSSVLEPQIKTLEGKLLKKTLN